MKKSDVIKLKIVNHHVAIITLNRPSAANSFSHVLLKHLNEKIQTINQNKNIYCTIITGSGDKVFCAGADLKERRDMTDDQVTRTVKRIGETIKNVEKMPMPVIAAINGVAYGGGLELALACDMRISADHVLLGLTETSLGIIPGAGGTQRLSRLVGLGQAKKLIFTGQPVPAKEALRIHLIEKIIDGKSLMDEAIHLAEVISANGPLALKQAKIAINNGYESDLKTGLTIEHLCYQQTIQTEDRLEGLKAFQEKRIPKFKGK